MNKLKSVDLSNDHEIWRVVKTDGSNHPLSENKNHA